MYPDNISKAQFTNTKQYSEHPAFLSIYQPQKKQGGMLLGVMAEISPGCRKTKKL
jgi:hypothetical protein